MLKVVTISLATWAILSSGALASGLQACAFEKNQKFAPHGFEKLSDIGNGLIVRHGAFSYDGRIARSVHIMDCRSGTAIGIQTYRAKSNGYDAVNQRSMYAVEVDRIETVAALISRDDFKSIAGFQDLLTTQGIKHGVEHVREVPCGCIANYPRLAEQITDFAPPLPKLDFKGTYKYTLEPQSAHPDGAMK